MELLAQGLAPVEVAYQIGVDRRSVRRWKAAVRKRGKGALKAKPAPGRPPALEFKVWGRIERILLKGALAAGYPTDLWTCPRIAEVIERKFAVSYHPDHVGRVLHQLGWSPQKPERRAVERDEGEIQRWVKEEWPRVKKTPRVAKRGSSSSTKPAS